MSEQVDPNLKPVVDRLNQVRDDEAAAKRRIEAFRAEHYSGDLNRAIHAGMKQQVYQLGFERDKLEREVARMMAIKMREADEAEKKLEAEMELLAAQGEMIPFEVARLNVGRRVCARVDDGGGPRWVLAAIEEPGSKKCRVKLVTCGTLFTVPYDRLREAAGRNPGPLLKPVPKPNPVIVKVGEETMQERQMRMDDRSTNEGKAALAAAKATLASTTDLNELAEAVKQAAARVKQAEADVKEAEEMVKEAKAKVEAEKQALATTRQALSLAVKALEQV